MNSGQSQHASTQWQQLHSNVRLLIRLDFWHDRNPGECWFKGVCSAALAETEGTQLLLIGELDCKPFIKTGPRVRQQFQQFESNLSFGCEVRYPDDIPQRRSRGAKPGQKAFCGKPSRKRPAKTNGYHEQEEQNREAL